jgi:hypothetical protein
MEERKLKLFAVRTVDNKEAVGLFWVPNLDTLSRMIDEVTDPGACEYLVVDEPAAVTWEGQAPAIGVEREDVEDEISDREALACGASFEFALEDILYREVVKGWTQLSY